ncbi:hypothetical protein [Streptomyces albipurpureus]|uniref:Chromosome segregation ATPase n=1 Tax=Streptomyces albipurpureus TaxID=2897419 RepID=A0ABT0UXY3_9ACTN|nr:hypothetical protein [Streptomyces sp. CWNU-1]MCM2393438.1 hypothetical protein [Streptomyces sp. CWNU-1]
MYELSRVRLYSIGPAGARYADTVLDLRGVGAPVPHPAPAQAEFFEEEPVGPPRRPAPAGVLFLENGGGKSVLLKLIFSVMLPGHRNTLGGASSGVLRKFLLADDCGHVALEWQHTLTGELIVVGKVSEWRGRQVSNDPRKFAEAWYSFRPGPGLSLDSLPVAESTAMRPSTDGASGARGRRRTMKGFRDAITEAGKVYPHLEVSWEEIHDRWNEHLGDLGLDPELFRYQREMNADEGEAAGLFAVKKDSDFTDLLLRAVTDTRDTDGLADLVSSFGNKLGRRAELTAERDFTAGSVDLLGRIVEAAEARSRAREIHTGSERRTRTLARRLSARAVVERTRTTDLAAQVTAAAHTVTEAEQRRGRSSLIAAELAYRHASLALAVAEKGAAAQRRELSDARTLHLAWQATEAVLRHRAAADRSARVAAAIQDAERDAAPALAARARAAADLVRALHSAAESGEQLAGEQEERSAALQEMGEAAHRDATAAATETQRARSEIGHLRQRLTEVEQETAEAVRAGWLDDTAPDADPARAALAANDAEKAAVAAWDAAREAGQATADRAKETAATEARAELAAARAADAARAAEHTYEAERRAAASIAEDHRLAELLSLPAPVATPVPSPRKGTVAADARKPGAVHARVDGPPALPDASADGPTPAVDRQGPTAADTATGARSGTGTEPSDASSAVAADTAHRDPVTPESAQAAPEGATDGSSGPRTRPDEPTAGQHGAADPDPCPEEDALDEPAPSTHAGPPRAVHMSTDAPTGSADTSTAAAEDVSEYPPAAETPIHTGRERKRHRSETVGHPAPRPAASPLSAEELDRYAEELRELLDQQVTSAERQLFELRTVAADDARILGALGDGGLLPPSPDVLATVEYLGEHGIPALPGWRYLAQAVDPVDHAAVLSARPELVDGVVITDPASHDRAREALTGAALLPRSAVAVGTAAALLAPVPAPGTDDHPAATSVFLVPPNPAMHDEQAADEERQTLRARAAARDDEIRTLAARLAGDRSIAARLASWRADCPPGMLAELARAAQTAREFAEEAQAELTEARTVRAEVDDAAADAARVREERQEAAQRARRAADALAGLAYRLRERAGWQVKLRELADEAAESEARATVCLERAKAADEDRRAAQRAGDDARRTARALRAERAEIAGAPESLPQPDPNAPRAALPELREAYRTASQLYEKVGVGADLRAEQARAESDESASLTDLDRLSNKVRTRAAQLLEGTDGADGPSRQAAAARAESLVQMLETRASEASEKLGRLRGEAERLAPADAESHTRLPDELVPADAAQAQTLLRSATGELALGTDALATARDTHTGLLQAHRAAEDAAGGFEETAALLRDLLRDRDDEESAAETVESYPGSLPEARQSAAEARRSLRGCAAELSAAEAAVREASDVLVRHANSTRYEQVRTPARQQIRELPAAALPEHAAKWAEAFAPRLRVLTDELQQLDRNRDTIVDRLRGLVESALATLRSAQRLSRLPEGLGEWSGQEFLRIRFEEPDHATLAERLGEVIDEATRTAVRKNSTAAYGEGRRDGMSLLLRGVQAALQPKGIAVEILKPDAVLRAERVPVGQMGDVFSGGQLLTAAIALYCTMAALRSNDRGRDRHRHAGTLFLDNPIGRANATYLLELQRAVSDALGVQLLYTTGLFDTTALAEFPLVIRLRNDADLRAGLKYISVEEHLRPGLPQQDPSDESVHGEITATRMFRRSSATADQSAPASSTRK